MERESARPGVLEKVGYLSRNVEIAIGVFASVLGHWGVAFISFVAAAIDHAFAEQLKKQRLQSQAA